MTNSNYEIRTFVNEEFGSVRTIEIDGEPWMVGKDVAEILGYSNPRDAIKKHVDDEDKGVAKCDTLGGAQDLSIINESGLYSLILSSKLPTAKKFKRWVTSEVLPSIRRNGYYAQDNSILQKSIEILQTQLLNLTVFDEYAANTWKKRISSPLIDKIASEYNIDNREAVNMIYEVMKRNFGFCKEAAIMKFNKKYCDNAKSAFINAVADEPQYQAMFTQAATIILNNHFSITYSVNEALQTTTKIDNSSVKSNDAMDIGDRIAHIHTEKSQFAVKDDFQDIVNILASMTDDNTLHHNYTLRKIYERMNTKRGWKSLLTRNHCKTKRMIIETNYKQKVKFVQVCNEILNELGSGTGGI